MTVKELIELLSKEDPNMEVTLNGYEEGLDSINSICHKFVKYRLDPKWYYGKYEECDNSDKRVLLLSRFQ